MAKSRRGTKRKAAAKEAETETSKKAAKTVQAAPSDETKEPNAAGDVLEKPAATTSQESNLGAQKQCAQSWSAEELAMSLGLSHVDLVWTEADYQNLTNWGCFVGIVKPQIRQANPRVPMAKLSQLLAAYWAEFKEEAKKKKKEAKERKREEKAAKAKKERRRQEKEDEEVPEECGIDEEEEPIAAATSHDNNPSAKEQATSTSAKPAKMPAFDYDSVDPDWMTKLPSQTERNKFLYNNEMMADIHFLVGKKKERVPAHKYMLSCNSPVFFKMFYGGLATQEKEIEVPDIEKDDFLCLLRYIYHGSIGLNMDNIMPILYSAKKYIIPALTDSCREYICNIIDKDSVLDILQQCMNFDEEELCDNCWKFIDNHSEDVLKAESFIDVDSRMLTLLLERDGLNCHEDVLFNVIDHWSISECERRGLEVTCQNKREVLGEALYLVRIPLMSVEEFVAGPVKSGILPDAAVVKMFLYYHSKSPHQVEIPFSDEPRNALFNFHRFAKTVDSGWDTVFRDFDIFDYNTLCFKVDSPILLLGFGSYGSKESEWFYIKYDLRRKNGRYLIDPDWRNDYESSSESATGIYPVMFSNPVHIEPNKEHFLTVVMKCENNGDTTCYGTHGMPEVVCGGVKFSFIDQEVVEPTPVGKYDYLRSRNSTTSRFGQIPQFIFKRTQRDESLYSEADVSSGDVRFISQEDLRR